MIFIKLVWLTQLIQIRRSDDLVRPGSVDAPAASAYGRAQILHKSITKGTCMNWALKLLAALVVMAATMTAVRAENPAVEAMQEYLEFATYDAGIIVPQQLTKEIFESVVFIDTRSEEQFGKEAIPGARHIEWREVLGRIDEIPTDKKVVLYCNTGSLSAQAAFALRVAGRTNVLVLQGGIEGWRKDAAFKP